MIVVPIVAAHGMTIPKTSSRAITSPAGTADTMEVLARVDLGIDEMREVVTACHGCLVWGGHVNLSPADDILISVERPLSLDTREQMVASIMSKKIAAGSTHLLIDLPVGPASKLTNAMEAMRLRKLFEFVGDHFGIAVEVVTTDGRQPIGNGIGPVLEAQDVMAVLSNDPAAPPTCAKSRFGSPLTCWNMIHSCAAEPVMRAPASCSIAARRSSRCRRSSMPKDRRSAGPTLGLLTVDVPAPRDGVVSGIDCLRLNRLARTAGAPLDKGAGIKIFKKIGDRVEKGEPLYRIFAFDRSEYDLAVAAAEDRDWLQHRWRTPARQRTST